MENKKEEVKEVFVNLNDANSNSLKNKVQSKQIAEEMLNMAILTILETKDIDYKDKNISISEDFKQLILISKK